MAYLSHHSALVLLAIGFFLAASNRPYTKQSGILLAIRSTNTSHVIKQW